MLGKVVPMQRSFSNLTFEMIFIAIFSAFSGPKSDSILSKDRNSSMLSFFSFLNWFMTLFMVSMK